MRKLFIYYSLSGNGDYVANYLKNRNIDIRKVVPKKALPHNMILRILKGGFLAGINYQDELTDFDSNISSYDEIIIGSPIWNGRLSTPINTVLSKIDMIGKKIVFILYSGSGEAPKASALLHEKYPNSEILIIKEPNKYQNEVKEALENI